MSLSGFRALVPSLIVLTAVLALTARAAHADDVIPRDAQPQWFKGNLHTHTLWSDGNDFPEMVAEWYRTKGYHFLALSDHNVLSEGIRWIPAAKVIRSKALEKYLARFGPNWVETRGEPGSKNHQVRLKPLNEFRAMVEERGKFLMIASEEITGRVHMNATNLKTVLKPLRGRTVVEEINANLRAIEEQAKKTGREILVHLNHPNFRYTVTAEDLAKVVKERFFEVYNGHPSVGHLGDHHHPPVEHLWDIANTIRIAQLKAPPLMGLATDDSHTYHGGKVSPGRGWVVVRATHLTPETLIRAIKRGDFYASSGVSLAAVELDEKSGQITLEIEADGDATFTTDFIGTPVDYNAESKPRTDAAGKPIRSSRIYSPDVGKVFATVKGRSPTYKLTGKELYVRAVVTSSKPHVNPSFKDQRKQAWTQPVGWQRHVNKE
jgi:hypothetical protein